MEPRWLAEYRRSESRPRLKRVSSRLTVLYKRILPGLVFVILGLWMVGALLTGVGQKSANELASALVWPVILCAFGYAVFRWYAFRLADEVWDCGETLLVRRNGRESVVRIADCETLTYRGLSFVPRIRVLLRDRATDLGKRIEFIPPFRFFSYALPPIARDLMDRMEHAGSEMNG